ncbi:MAG TPA: SDR family NAD(P)-dependent oxidoreductase, partial [bacterium]|nr:SDR family NAD(P)-dependent oxidoreductase [bacterium]
MRLKDKVAIITGVSTGIGKAAAIRFAQEGAHLVITRFQNPVTEVEQAAENAGRKTIVVKVDMRKTEDVNQLVDTAIKEFGRIDIAFSNAGILSWARCEDITDEEWDFVVDCDLKGTFRLFRAALPVMKKQKYGRLLATTSISGSVWGWPG